MSTALHNRRILKKERKWLKYRTAELWTAYKLEVIKFNKRHKIHMTINENRNDTRKLYKIVHTLTGQHSKNPLPEVISDVELAEEFSDFFLQKINMIRQQLNKIEAYQPTEGDVPQLQKFSTINEHELRDTIMKMLIKSCELDIFTMSLLKMVFIAV